MALEYDLPDISASGRREVAMRLRKTLTFLTLTIGIIFALSAWAQEQPYTQEQVSNMVRAGLGDDFGSKLIGERGITFAPGEDFLQDLKAAGASEVFLKALRAAKPTEPTSTKKPLNQVQVFALLSGGIAGHRVGMLVQERGIDFEPTDEYIQEIRLAGGEDELISALKSAKVTKPVVVDPATQARQVEIRQHVARGAELVKKGLDAEAEQEYRGALLLDTQNADLYLNLAYVLNRQKNWDDAASAAREALRLNPNSDMAHTQLGFALNAKGDPDGGISEYREALRLNPNNDEVHTRLGGVLGNKADWDGAAAEYREALRLNPKDDTAHFNLGNTLLDKGDKDAAIAEFREALRLNPKNNDAHVSLGIALEGKDDWDGAIAEFHEALRLDPKDESAHQDLGLALAVKGDMDGEIAEEREALRLNPRSAGAHVGLGYALERKGDPKGALEEYRTAYTIDPNNAGAKRSYEQLLQQMR